ncbi:hypothetical protein KAJ83_14375 [Marivibrio halodurans]|uniref:Lipoprotein n=1 Tax=Marivibrio halodurans TaxID=2039722 RepID=A0A8J7SA11_9PROT|nr:hypothetical protein [Marivibrio halodurans]MBP5858202.1 hypothetical protein [Marivibrio halodurans]
MTRARSIIQRFGSAFPGLAALAGATALLSACASDVEVPRYADITFAYKQPIALDVADIEVVRVYKPRATPPNVETEFPVSPLETAARWANDRLRAVGDSGTATLRILEAGVVEKPLEKDTGVTGLFKTDQAAEYTARYVVELSAEATDSQTGARTRAEVTRSQTVPEGLTYNERERVWYQLTEKLARDLDRQMEENIHQHLRPFLTD